MLQRRGAVCLIALLVALALTTAIVAGEKKVWVLKRLPGPSGEKWLGTFPNEVSDTGYIVGAWIDVDGVMRGAYWKKGKFHDLYSEIGLPGDATAAYVISVNNGGLMCGAAGDDKLAFYGAVLWDAVKETVTDLHPGGDLIGSEARGINESGDVVGSLIAEALNPWGMSHIPYIWPNKNRKGAKLPMPDGYYHGLPMAINSSGDIVGYGVTTGFTWHAVMWERGQDGKYVFHDLQKIIGDDEFPESEAWDIQENGNVVGFGYVFDADLGVYLLRAFTWNAVDGLTVLDDDGTGNSQAWKGNANYVSGGIGMWIPTGPYYYPSADDAVVWRKGVLDLVATEFAGRTHVESWSVNKKGLVVGAAFEEIDPDKPESYHPIGWYAVKVTQGK